MAAIELGLCPNTCRPYVPQPDSIADRQIRHVEEGAKKPHHWTERLRTIIVALRVPLFL